MKTQKSGWMLLALVIGLLAITAPVLAQDSTVTAEAFRVVNIRSNPGVEQPIVGQLNPGDVVPVIGRSNSDNDWLQVQSANVSGWVAFFVVTVSGDLETLPIVETEAAVTTDNAVRAQGASATVETLQTSDDDVTASAFRRANVRTLPNTSSPILTVLRRGDVVSVVGRNSEDADWLQVVTDDGTGWVAYFVVTVSGDASTLPIVAVDAPASATATPVGSIGVTTRFNANLRTIPDLTADLVQVIPYNTEMRADGRTSDGEWLRVTLDGTTGWILTSLIAVLENGNIRALPVTEPQT